MPYPALLSRLAARVFLMADPAFCCITSETGWSFQFLPRRRFLLSRAPSFELHPQPLILSDNKMQNKEYVEFFVRHKAALYDTKLQDRVRKVLGQVRRCKIIREHVKIDFSDFRG